MSGECRQAAEQAEDLEIGGVQKRKFMVTLEKQVRIGTSNGSFECMEWWHVVMQDTYSLQSSRTQDPSVQDNAEL